VVSARDPYGRYYRFSRAESNIQSIQTFQNKALRGTVNAPWHARNSGIHRDLGIRMVTAEIKGIAKKHQHTNVEAIQLLDNERTVRRLK
jgi:hypothetical protein